MSYVHEGQTDAAVAELQKNAAIDQAGKDLVALSGSRSPRWRTSCSRRVASDAAEARFREGLATIEKADVAAQVKEAAQRQALFDAARVALARNDVAAAKAKADEYAKAVAAKSIPFEVRQSHELQGRIALAEKRYDAAATELRQANQQDPRVLYLTATALQGKGDVLAAKQVGTAGRRLQRPVRHLRLRSGQGPGDAQDGEDELSGRRPSQPRAEAGKGRLERARAAGAAVRPRGAGAAARRRRAAGGPCRGDRRRRD